jgi:hypothetical protein
MEEKDPKKEERESGNRISHENAEERGENTVPPEEAPLPSNKSTNGLTNNDG